MTEKMVPVFANRAPWNDLVLDGKRHVKTLSFNWKHRGPILLYTSSNRVDWWGFDQYDMTKQDIPKGVIVGSAMVVDVVPTDKLPQIFYDKDPNLEGTMGQEFVVIVENPRRFKRPIPFKPPQGTIRISSAPARYLRRVVL